MTITTRLYTYFHGQLIGMDRMGNKYYSEKRAPKGRREKRWVMYQGAAEPSKVAPEWHGWLHYTTNVPPNKQHRTQYAWEKPQQANPTGTAAAYLPPGHLARGGEHAATVAEYEPWRP